MEFNGTLFAQYLILGVTNGALIALIALGYTLVYGIVELINFAHGEVFMMGAFLSLTAVSAFGVVANAGWAQIALVSLVAMLAAMLFSGVLNWSIDRVVYRRLRAAPRLAPLIAAIGISFILQGVGIYWKGSTTVLPPNLIPTDIRSINILTDWLGLETRLRFRALDLAVILLTVPLLLGLSWLVYRTRTGKAMRAVAQDRGAAALMGIDVNRTIATAFLVGGILAGLLHEYRPLSDGIPLRAVCLHGGRARRYRQPQRRRPGRTHHWPRLVDERWFYPNVRPVVGSTMDTVDHLRCSCPGDGVQANWSAWRSRSRKGLGGAHG
jgi:branched-chain amino acid transport system permease protein